MEDEEHDAEKRKPGRPRKVVEETHEPEPHAKGTKVTWRPLDNGDPVHIDWDGVKFEANVPRLVTRKDLVELAKLNPWFEVEGHPRAKRVKPTAEKITPPGTDVDPIALDDRKMVEED